MMVITKHSLATRLIALCALLSTLNSQLSTLRAQELLLPLYRQPRAAKEATEVRLPFFDDFSSYEGAPDPRLWATQDAFVNRDYAPLPPTLGMATLDVLDAHGALHATAAASRFGADTLLSQPLRMDSLFSPTRRRLTPADSVVLSFFYLPGGGSGPLWERVGEAPDEEDSLILEFLDPQTQEWNLVWATGGTCVDSLLSRTGHSWQYVALPITDPRYLQRGFRFRLRNLASLEANPKPGLVGNTDQWNIDYVLLSHGRRVADRATRDVAFVERAPSLLAQYQAMPWRQYSESDMAQRLEMTIVNRYSQALTTQYAYTVYNDQGTPIHHYDGGHENAPAFYPDEQYQTSPAHARPPVGFAYPVGGPCSFSVEHVVREGVGGDPYPCNDTLHLTQTFADYYAYDDGVPENGYGVATTSRCWIACRFALSQPDTLTAIDLYFNQTRNQENLAARFYFCVWADNAGQPGALLHRESLKRQPETTDLNRYHRYRLVEPLPLDGPVFIGLEQQGSAFLNLGFDRSNDARAHTYYRTGNQWQQSILRGALMLRPCFGQSALVGIDAPAPGQPQPVATAVFDLLGRRVAEGPDPALPPGAYLRRTLLSNGTLTSEKIIIK